MGKFVKKTIVGGVLAPFLGGGKQDAAPAQPAPAVMPEAPDSNDETVRAAKRKKAAEMQSRGGRLSTMLSDSGADKLG